MPDTEVPTSNRVPSLSSEPELAKDMMVEKEDTAPLANSFDIERDRIRDP